MKLVQGSELPDPIWIRYKTDTEAVIRLRANIKPTETGYSWNEIETKVPLVSGLEAAIQAEFWELWDAAGGGFPLITKFTFRQLLNSLQKLVWDNFDLLKEQLGLTDMQFMQMRSFRADFDSSRKVNMELPLMTGGLQTIADWELELDGQAVFTDADVERILAGTPVQ
jgi:hypothetical protein